MILSEFIERPGIDTSRFYNAISVIKPNLEGPWLAGGSIRRMIDGDTTQSDYDVFFASRAQLDLWLERIKKHDNIIKIDERQDNTTIMLKDGEHTFEIQAIHVAFYENAEQVIDSFDFTICQFATNGTQLYAGKYSLYDLGKKRLVVHRITYPIASMRRMIKYVKQGFYACNGFMETFLRTVVDNPASLEQKTKYID